MVQRRATIAITYYALAGMDVATVTNIMNYVRDRCSGARMGASLGNGNDVDLSGQINGIAYDPASGTATLQLAGTLPADVIQLWINGTAGKDANGTPLLDTDFVTQILPDSHPPTVSLSLETASDDNSASNTDHITNIKTPRFDVTVNKGGVIAWISMATGPLTPHRRSQDREP